MDTHREELSIRALIKAAKTERSSTGLEKKARDTYTILSGLVHDKQFECLNIYLWNSDQAFTINQDCLRDYSNEHMMLWLIASNETEWLINLCYCELIISKNRKNHKNMV